MIGLEPTTPCLQNAPKCDATGIGEPKCLFSGAMSIYEEPSNSGRTPNLAVCSRSVRTVEVQIQSCPLENVIRRRQEGAGRTTGTSTQEGGDSDGDGDRKGDRRPERQRKEQEWGGPEGGRGGRKDRGQEREGLGQGRVFAHRTTRTE